MDDLEQHKLELQESISRVRHHGNEMHRILGRHSEGGAESLTELFETLAGFSDNLRRSILRHRLLMLDVSEKTKAWMTAYGCVRAYRYSPWHLGDSSKRTLCGLPIHFNHSNPEVSARQRDVRGEIYFLARNFVQVPPHTEKLCEQCCKEPTMMWSWKSPTPGGEWTGDIIMAGARFIAIPPTK